MSQLHDLQGLFGNYLCGDDAGNIADFFQSRHCSAKDILTIHRNNFRLTLTETLGSIYPAVRNLIGEDCFAAHAGRFVENSPPSSPVLSCWGGGLPDDLDRRSTLQSVPYLSDVARLEWAWNEAFHSADAKPLTPDALYRSVAKNTADREFDLHPALRLVTSSWPIFDIWKYARSPDKYKNEPDLLKGPQHVLILRPRVQVFVIPVDPGIFSFLSAWQASGGFTEALTAVPQSPGVFVLEEVLARLLVWGGFSFNRNTI